MKIYIPFNSNDFNSIFTTLSIAPRSFYPLRNYSFKRATPTLLNPLENFLIAFTQPVFSQKDQDKENGYVINLLIDYPEENLLTGNCRLEEVQCFLINETIYLHNNFQLIYRSKNEQKETEARSLKSIETKFAEIASRNSAIIDPSKVYFVPGELPYSGNPDMSLEPNYNFQKERVFNKLTGALLGFAVGYKSQLSPAISAMKNLLREVNNLSSLYFNKLGESDARITKERLLSALDEIKVLVDEQQSLEEALVVSPHSELNSELISTLKEKRFGKRNFFDWIIEGFLNDKTNKTPLPFHLIIEKAKRQINKKYNSKFPDNYIKDVSKSLSDIKVEAENIIESDSDSNSVNVNNLIHLNDGKFEIPNSIESKESEYFQVVLNYFLSKPNLSNPDQLHSNRIEILKELGVTLGAEIEGFKDTAERTFLLELLKSFNSLRSTLDPKIVNFITFQSLAVLFTSGRELQKYLDGLTALGVNSLAIPISIWGAAFGYASLPKTLTGILLDDNAESQIFFEIFKDAEKSFFSRSNLGSIEEPEVDYLKPESENGAKAEGESYRFISNSKYSKYEDLEKKISKFEEGAMFKSELTGEDLKKFLRQKENKIPGIGPKSIEEIASLYDKERLVDEQN